MTMTPHKKRSYDRFIAFPTHHRCGFLHHQRFQITYGVIKDLFHACLRCSRSRLFASSFPTHLISKVNKAFNINSLTAFHCLNTKALNCAAKGNKFQALEFKSDGWEMAQLIIILKSPNLIFHILQVT